MAKRKTKFKRHRPREIICVCTWCGYHFEAAREDAKTCSGKCRQRLGAYVREFQWEPDSPLGDLTASEAIRDVINKLVLDELMRRRGLSKVQHLTGRGQPRG